MWTSTLKQLSLSSASARSPCDSLSPLSLVLEQRYRPLPLPPPVVHAAVCASWHCWHSSSSLSRRYRYTRQQRYRPLPLPPPVAHAAVVDDDDDATAAAVLRALDIFPSSCTKPLPPGLRPLSRGFLCFNSFITVLTTKLALASAPLTQRKLLPPHLWRRLLQHFVPAPTRQQPLR